jgi:uncharacterized membrane protein
MPSGSITTVAVAAILFTGLHFLMSGPLRRPMQGIFGPGRAGVYSLIIAVPFAWMVWAYGHAPYVELWGEPVWARHLQLPLTLIAITLLVLGLISPNPTLSTVGEGALRKIEEPRGVIAITRQPFNMGAALWALGHLLVNGDTASVWLFGSVLVLAIGGALHIDARKRQSGDPDWAEFERRTSLVPFAAILAGKAKFRFEALDWLRLCAALATWVILLFLHQPLIGVSPFPS